MICLGTRCISGTGGDGGFRLIRTYEFELTGQFPVIDVDQREDIVWNKVASTRSLTVIASLLAADTEGGRADLIQAPILVADGSLVTFPALSC